MAELCHSDHLSTLQVSDTNTWSLLILALFGYSITPEDVLNLTSEASPKSAQAWDMFGGMK